MNGATRAVIETAIRNGESMISTYSAELERLRKEAEAREGFLAAVKRELDDLRASLGPAAGDFPGAKWFEIGLTHLFDPIDRLHSICGLEWQSGMPVRTEQLPPDCAWVCGTCRRLEPSKGYWGKP